jgi:Peptidase family S41
MKKSVLSIGIMAAAIMSCGRQTSPAVVSDQFSGSEFLYLDKTDRAAVLTDLRDMVLDNYVLLSIKAARNIVTNPKQTFDDIIAREATIADAPDSDILGQARSNTQFLDRIRAAIAVFQDTHFSSAPIVARPAILNGIEVRKVAGSLVVSAKRPMILEFDASHAVDAAAYKKIAVGMKVVSVDGVAASTAAEALSPYISSSTPGARDMWAAAALSQRSFSYPEKSYADWEFSADDGSVLKVRLPFFYSTTVSRKDANYYLKAKGFQPINDLKLVWSEKDHNWTYSRTVAVEGFDPLAAPTALIGETIWNGVDDKTGEAKAMTFRTGYILKNGKSYGVLQIFEFSSAKVSLSKTPTPETTKLFKEPVVQFVKSLKESATPLIIDLRQNGGGDPMNSIAVLSAIARANESYPSTNRALRVTRVIRQMLELDDAGSLPDLNHFNYDLTSLQELHTAVASHQEYTNAFTLTDDVKADPAVGGYEQKVVALIGPMCISACDGMGMLLKASKRATLIGTHTNGTGAGFIGDDQFDGSHWRDHLQVVSLRIPNRLFGPGGAVGQRVFNEPDAYIKYNSENLPTVADKEYIESVGDIKAGASKWFENAVNVLDAQLN